MRSSTVAASKTVLNNLDTTVCPKGSALFQGLSPTVQVNCLQSRGRLDVFRRMRLISQLLVNERRGPRILLISLHGREAE